MTWLLDIPRRVWWFVSGLCRNVRQWVLDALGRVRVYGRPLWFVFGPRGYEVKARHLRKALAFLEPGDVLVRRYDSCLLSLLIPGRFSHSGVYVGTETVCGDTAGVVVHALGTGVQKTDVIDFLMGCAGFAVLRPKCGPEGKDLACRIARRYVGVTYDYRFDICEDYDNLEEVQARTRSVYCHELTRSCFPRLRVPTLLPQLWNGMVRSSKRQFLADSFFESPDFEVVYDSFYSEVQA